MITEVEAPSYVFFWFSFHSRDHRAELLNFGSEVSLR